MTKIEMLLANARIAQKQFEAFDQQQVDACVKANNGLWNAEAEKILLAALA